MKLKNEEGQSTVEFALILPILILLIFGMIDFGWLFYNKIEINNASREGARYAAVHWYDSDCISNTTELVRRFANESSVSVSSNAAATEVVVSVNKDVQVLTGIASTFVGDKVNLTSTCTMRIE